VSAKDQLKAANEQIKAAMKDADKLVKDAIAELAGVVFDQHPNVKSFAIRGYTPSFNDGDPCTFRFSRDPYRINGCDPDDSPDDSAEKPVPTDADWESGERWDSDKRKVVKVGDAGWAYLAKTFIRDSFSILTEDQAERMFGTNFLLTFKRKRGGGVTVKKKEYDCGY
jgi:hypothetical protein